VTFVTVKQAVAEIPTATFLALRFSLAFVALIPFFRREITSAWRRLAGPGLVLGLLMWGGYYLQTLGVALTQASRAGFITGLAVVLVPVLSAFIVGERPAGRAVAGVALALAGLVCLFLLPSGAGAGGAGAGTAQAGTAAAAGAVGGAAGAVGGTAGSVGRLRAGDLLVLACTLSFALQVTLTGLWSPSRARDYREAGALATLQMGVAALLSLAVVTGRFVRGGGSLAAVFFPGATLTHPFSTSTAAGIVVCGLFASAGALLVQTVAQRFTPPTHTAIIFATEPVFAVLAGWLLLDERLGTSGAVGCLLILAGMLAAEMPLGGPPGAGRDRGPAAAP